MDPLLGAAGVYAGTFAIAAISSVVPLVSIDVYLVGITLARGAGDATVLVVLATLGQMFGKLPIYYAARGISELPGRQRRWIERTRGWVARSGASPHLVLASSAVFGLPPFSIISTAAGALAIRPRAFCVVIAPARALRFAALIYFVA